MAQTSKELEVFKTKRLQVRKAVRSALLVPFLILVLHAIGIFLFSSGFLLSRTVLDNVSTIQPSSVSDVDLPKTFEKVIVVLIDALRFDFVVPPETSDDGNQAAYLNALQTPLKLSQGFPNNAGLFKFIADPPTTTLQRIKALTTGSLPTFIDAGSNFAGKTVEEDSWLAQLRNKGKKIAFTGDDTWTHLFPNLTDSELTFPFDSFNVWDLHTVDNGVIDHLSQTLPQSEKWDVIVAHLLGVDHAGHRYGPNTIHMREKLQQMDQLVQNLTKVLSNDQETLLLVFGDHGMDPKGDHGGDSQGEIESSLFLYSGRKFLSETDNIPVINQIDLVPTLSLLLDLPVPFNNLGSPIASAFLGPQLDTGKLASANKIVSDQISRYRNTHPSFRDEALSTSLYNLATTAWQKQDFETANEKFHQFQLLSLAECRSLWAHFDLVLMFLGIVVFILSIIVLALFIIAFNNEDESATDYIKFIGQKIAVGIFAGISSGLAAGVVFSKVYSLTAFGIAAGIVFGFVHAIYALRALLSNPFNNSVSKWTILAAVYAILPGIQLGSNSYVVWESRSLSFLLVSFGVVALISSLRLPQANRRTSGVINSIVFIVLSRLAEYPKICREEQLPYCTSTLYASTASSVSSLTTIVLLYVTALVLPAIVRSFLRTSASYEGSAPLWIGIGLRSVLLLSAAYWTLDFSANDGSKTAVEEENLQIFKQIIARLILGVTLVGTPIAWLRGRPLCLRIDMTNNEDKIKQAQENGDLKTASKTAQVSVEIIGFANTYGSLYLLFTLAIFAFTSLCSKPASAIALAGLVYQILTLLELSDILSISSSSALLTPTILALLASLYYFSTGHQATLASLQWDVAFIFTRTVQFPLSHLPLLFNTFGSFIITGIAVPLVLFYKYGPSPRDSRRSIVLVSKLVRTTSVLSLYFAILTVINLVVTFVLRRHLMVWKIFAPRFMLAGTAVLVVDIAVVFATAFGGQAVLTVFDVFK
ncbi:hypothetical protein V1514DRAFT_325477 [Lipomyces japonicus]|uniref:uncharacterized protein n=1 Tax=Lipomyces japonicus TaxID=56871 RepID=UPI0034CD8F94